MTSAAIPPATLPPLLEPLLGAERPRRFGVLWLGAPFVWFQLPLWNVSTNGWVFGVVSVLPAVVVLLCYALGLAARPTNRMQVALPAARRASILTFDPANADAVRAMLETCRISRVEIDGIGIRSLTDLARCLDAALGPFQYPTDPLAKVLAHIGHESRAVGERAILWHGAATMLAADPAGLAHVIAAWSRAMRTADGRLLLVDAAPAERASGGEPTRASTHVTAPAG